MHFLIFPVIKGHLGTFLSLSGRLRDSIIYLDKIFREPEPVIDFVQELELFYAWLKKEPYLPRKLDEEILITFLWDTEVVEEAEAKLMNYYYARQSIPQVFHNRHPCSPKNLAKYDAV